MYLKIWSWKRMKYLWTVVLTVNLYFKPVTVINIDYVSGHIQLLHYCGLFSIPSKEMALVTYCKMWDDDDDDDDDDAIVYYSSGRNKPYHIKSVNIDAIINIVSSHSDESKSEPGVFHLSNLFCSFIWKEIFTFVY